MVSRRVCLSAGIDRQIKLFFNLVGSGFTRNQYSDGVRQGAPHHDRDIHWNRMWGLENIPPPDKFSSTVKALRHDYS